MKRYVIVIEEVESNYLAYAPGPSRVVDYLAVAAGT